MVEAAGAAASTVWPLVVAHDGGPKNSRMATWTGPACVTFTSLTGSRARRSATTSRVTVVATETLCKFFLSQLLGLV